jgi:redox-sensitive bicupin YhaK (pirin superfamily)
MRGVAERFPPPEPHWVGDGFPVRTIFFYQGLGPRITPFLLLDYAGPTAFPPAQSPRGVAPHPHKGFETVTILYQGGLEHRDSAGNRGSLEAGDVQWMTAGMGIVHEEKHGAEFTRRGGTLEAVQLWVNLPARFKNVAPGYQTLSRAAIPILPLPGGSGTARVIAGEFAGTRGPARTFTPVNVIELRLAAGGELLLPLTDGHTALLLPLRGRVTLNRSQSLDLLELALLDRQGGAVRVGAGEEALVLALSGEPIDEPTVGYGPFVLNSQAEIQQAVRDYQAGRMGRIAKEGVGSEK